MITPKATGTPQKVTATQNSNLIMMTPKAPKATKNNKWQQKITKDTPKSNQATTKQRQAKKSDVRDTEVGFGRLRRFSQMITEKP